MGGMLKRTGAEVITMSLGSILITTTAEKIEEPNFIGAMFKRRRTTTSTSAATTSVATATGRKVQRAEN